MFDFAAFVQDMDRCWLEQRFDDLSAFMAENVVIIAPGGTQRAEGLAAAIESYRDFMSRSTVEAFDTANHVVSRHSATAVVEYAWAMTWRSAAESHNASGREILVLTNGEMAWRVVWRMQIAG